MHTSKSTAVLLAAAAVALSLSQAAQAQPVADLVLVEGDIGVPLDPEKPETYVPPTYGSMVGGEWVWAINRVNGNGLGGYAANIRTSSQLVNGTSATDRFFGTAAIGPAGVLRNESPSQTAFSNFFGYSNTGDIGYIEGTSTALSFYVNHAQLAAPNAAIAAGSPLAGGFYGNIRAGGMSNGGTPWYYAAYQNSAGGGNVGEALFAGYNAGVLLKSGDSIAGLPTAIAASNAFSFNTALSPSGSAYLTTANLTTGSAGVTNSNNTAVILSGSLLTLGSSAVREGTVVPGSVGGNGTEAYQNFGTFGINNAGTYALIGDTNAATSGDGYVLFNGAIVLREGGSLNGQTLDGNPNAVNVNANGDWAVSWELTDGVTDSEVFIVNGEVVFGVGDAVDLDGDGLGDTVLTSITGGDAFAFSDRFADGSYALTFIGLTEATGSRDALLTVVIPEPASAAVLGLGALGLLTRRRRA